MATQSFDVDPAAGFRVDLAAPQTVAASVASVPTVATFTLDRPERRNCQSPLMWREFVRVRRELPGTVRILVLRADGPAFSAGLDRALFTDTSEVGMLGLAHQPHDEATGRIASWQEAFDWSSRPDTVSVAAVQGHAVGGGFQLALGCDIRVVADDVQFCMAEPTLGIVPDLGGTKRLADLVGYSRAVEICLTGRRIGAEEALRIGLASHTVPGAELAAAQARTVAALLAVDRDAAAETKALLQGATHHSQAEQQTAERDAQYRRLRTIANLDTED